MKKQQLFGTRLLATVAMLGCLVLSLQAQRPAAVAQAVQVLPAVRVGPAGAAADAAARQWIRTRRRPGCRAASPI